jgi:hypothetical protein
VADHLRDSLYRLGFDEVSMWRLRKQVVVLAKQVVQLAGDLGLSPSARARIGVAEVRVIGSPSSLMERAEAGTRTII